MRDFASPGCWYAAAGMLGCWHTGLLACCACWHAGLLACWAAGMLGCWHAGLLACWAAGMLACGHAGLLACWAAGMLGCWHAGLLACWAAGMLACWQAGLLACWAAGMLGCWHAGRAIIPSGSLLRIASRCGCRAARTVLSYALHYEFAESAWHASSKKLDRKYLIEQCCRMLFTARLLYSITLK